MQLCIYKSIQYTVVTFEKGILRIKSYRLLAFRLSFGKIRLFSMRCISSFLSLVSFTIAFKKQINVRFGVSSVPVKSVAYDFVL